MENSQSITKSFLTVFFWLHDEASSFLSRHMQEVKRAILVVAHLTLLGFFIPTVRSEFGEWAATLLIVILFLSPLSQLFRMRILLLLMGLRRELGIAMAYLAIVHGMGYLLDSEWSTLMIYPFLPGNILSIEKAFLMGMGALILTLPLLITSNNMANRILGGKKWKQLHRVVYVVFLFAIFHRLLVRGADPVSMIQAAILLTSYVLLKLLAWRNFLPPLAELCQLVSVRYQDYEYEKQESMNAKVSV